MRRTYFMTVIDGVFCLGMRAINRPETRFNRHVVTLDWSEIMGSYNTPVTVVRDRRT